MMSAVSHVTELLVGDAFMENGIRTELKNLKNVRRTFQGTFERFGVKGGYKGPLKTILLLHVVNIKTKKEVTDHLWFNFTKGFATLELAKGDVVEFCARSRPYVKGCVHRDDDNRIVDYKLSNPTQCRVVSRCDVQHNAVPRDIPPAMPNAMEYAVPLLKPTVQTELTRFLLDTSVNCD